MKNPTSTILVVDDAKNDQMLIKLAFKKFCPAKVIRVVDDGCEGMAYLKGEGKYADRTRYAFPCLITTDLKMPKVDGFDLLAFVQSHRTYAFVPVIELSGSRDADDVKRAYKLGASAYHVKPAGLEELRELVNTVCHYWKNCELPAMDESGQEVPTASAGKLGERFDASLPGY